MAGLIIAIVLFAGLASANGDLPREKVPEKFFQCKQDKDCAVAGDSCRSCGDLIVINKKYLKKFQELDLKERRKKKTMRSCEACSTQHVLLKCVQAKCQQGATAP